MKRTKILATISDLKCDVNFLQELAELGMNGVRVNTAHQMPEDTLKIVENVRTVSEDIPIVVDTKGPEVRTRGLKEPLTVKGGDEITVFADEEFECDTPAIATNYSRFVSLLKTGAVILIDDGDVGLKVKEEGEEKIICEVLNPGVIAKNKSINVPGVHIDLPSLTEKDRLYVDFCIENDIDFIAHSFVRNKEDVIEIQEMLDAKKSNVKIIAKIENQEGVNNIDEILDHVYGVMIARGDLGIEIPAERIPAIQKMIVHKCIEKKKLVITATQMLHSMIKSPRPTRAEVSDVANAIIDGTDVLMLSGESAYGDYPHEAVSTMTNIAKELETDNLFKVERVVELKAEVPAFISKTAEKAAQELPIKAIITNTLTGKTARYLSAHRGENKIFTECYERRVSRELALSYGVFPIFSELNEGATAFIPRIAKIVQEKEGLDDEDLLLVLGGNFGPQIGASFFEIGKVKDIKRQ